MTANSELVCLIWVVWKRSRTLFCFTEQGPFFWCSNNFEELSPGILISLLLYSPLSFLFSFFAVLSVMRTVFTILCLFSKNDLIHLQWRKIQFSNFSCLWSMFVHFWFFFSPSFCIKVRFILFNFFAWLFFVAARNAEHLNCLVHFICIFLWSARHCSSGLWLQTRLLSVSGSAPWTNARSVCWEVHGLHFFLYCLFMIHHSFSLLLSLGFPWSLSWWLPKCVRIMQGSTVFRKDSQWRLHGQVWGWYAPLPSFVSFRLFCLFSFSFSYH